VNTKPDEQRRLPVVIGWHMHQPEYRDGISGEYQQPWTYLHAIKDYLDMAEHLAQQPNAKAVINFAPTLLEQILDYSAQIEHFFHDNGPLRDPILAALVQSVLPVETDQRLFLIKACLRANKTRLIDRFPAYLRLYEMAMWLQQHPDLIGYVSNQYLADLLVWYHLAWMGETLRREHPLIQALMSKGHDYTVHERRSLLALIQTAIASLIPRYRALHAAGVVELAMSPYAHPMLPLLLDLHSAREAMPDVPLPSHPEYPGGEERARWHVRQGLSVFKKCFGFVPRGCWPSEGGVSLATLKVLGSFDFQWIATGESVLRNSLYRTAAEGQTIHRPYRLLDCKLHCFFRDDRLSDSIGFEYAHWHADDAVANLIGHLEQIANNTRHPEERVVTIFLDGENAWEYYPENAYYFLSVLYERIAAHPRLKLTTFSECLDAKIPAGALSHLVAGSWVYGNFATWIGDADKNRGWDMLIDAKQAYDQVVHTLSPKHRAAAEHQLAVCEGSDWFWWFGDYNPAHSVSDFERLFRLQLAALYQMLGHEPPDYLGSVFTHGGGTPEMGGAMRKN